MKSIYEKLYTKEFLQKEYLEKEKTYDQIGKENNTHPDVVKYWAKKHKIKSRIGGRKHTDISGKRFGNLTVIRLLYNEYNKKRKKWECLCDCKNIVIAEYGALVAGQLGCFSCSRKRIGNAVWKGYQEISGAVFSRIKKGATSRNLKFEVTIEYLWDLYIFQKGRCALTGQNILFNKRGEKISYTTASLDRINSSEGYIEENVQWVHKKVNFMKQALPQEEFIKICKMVANNFKD